jgi:hypothetical protein
MEMPMVLGPLTAGPDFEPVLVFCVVLELEFDEQAVTAKMSAAAATSKREFFKFFDSSESIPTGVNYAAHKRLCRVVPTNYPQRG